MTSKDKDLNPPPKLSTLKKHVKLVKSFSTPDYITSKVDNKKSPSLLPKCLTSKKSLSIDSEANYEDNWNREYHCMEYGKPPPIEEPDIYSIFNETTRISSSKFCNNNINNDNYEVNKNIIDKLLIKLMKNIGGRLELLDDFETTDDDNINDIKDNIKNCRIEELNVLLLQSSYLGNNDLLKYLHSIGADINYYEKTRGINALHLSAFSDNIIGVKYLITNGVTFYSADYLYTPFHYAAFGNSINVINYFIELNYPQDSPKGIESVLHIAARYNLYDIIKLLSPNNNWLKVLDKNGLAPIHYIADHGDKKCLEIIINSDSRTVNLLTKNGCTPLHLACESGLTDNVELLLKNNADIRIRNSRNQTALHLAACTHSLDCVELLLKNSCIDPNDEDYNGRTALHLALGRSHLAYDVTELLIDWRADVNKADKYGYTPLHVAALNELSQCVDILIQNGADVSARTKGGTTPLSIILRKTPTSLNVFKNRLDSSITLHQQNSPAGEMELRLDFHPLLQHKGQGEIGYLGTFVKEGYKEILEHPLCQSFLHLKWQKIRKYYVGRLFFYLVYVLVLTSWVMTALAHNCYNESHGQIDDGLIGSLPLCANSTGLNGFFHRHPKVLEVEWYALVVLTFLEGIRKATGILTYPSVKQFLTQPENIVEWCVILSVFATSFVYTGRTYTWQSHVGAFAVLCGWSNLMLMIGQLPMFGAYVAMFTSVQAQVFKLLLAYACLLVGFTASFCVIFPRSKSFSSPHTGLIKVLVMMTGELDFEELFFPGEEDIGRPVDVGSTSWILLQVSAQLSFVLFLLFVTIVLMNLLVGIAVHDIKGLQKTAGLAKLVRQTKLICDVESALLLALLPQRLIKLLSWTTLVLSSPLRAVLTVRPLNPREKRLPRDVLVAAYNVARNKRNLIGIGTLSSKHSISSANIYRRKSELQQLPYNYYFDNINNDWKFDDDIKGINKYDEKITELINICEDNRKLVENLLSIIQSNQDTENKDNQNN